MRISYLELRNYRRFRDLKLEFPDGIIGILGLNGSGKSTIIEGISWALFGNEQEVVRTSRESIRRASAGAKDSVAAVLEFELEGISYRIEREMGGRNLSMNVVLSRRDGTIADGDRTVRVAINKLLGMDHKSFFTSVFARQKELNELQEFPAAERKKIVLRMLRIDGVDSAIKLVREDRKSTDQKIQGAETMLLDSEGKDREAATSERMKALVETKAMADRRLSEAQKEKEARVRERDLVRKRRDSLAKDFERFKTADADLKALRRSIAEDREREAKLASRVAEIEKASAKLPELERANNEWQDIRKRKEALDAEKARLDKREMLLKDVAGLEDEIAGLTRDLDKMRAETPDRAEVERQLASISSLKTECENERSALSDEIAAAKARAEERRSRLEKERDRLERIRQTGRKGQCPTCERTLEEAYDPLVEKLEGGLAEAERAIAEDVSKMEAAQAALAINAKKFEALEKKKRRQDELLARAGQMEAGVSALENGIARAKAKLADKKKSVEAMGEVRFSAEEYETVREAHERLSQKHEEYVRLHERQKQLDGMKRDLEETRESIGRRGRDEKELLKVVSELEPRKEGYDQAVKEFEERNDKANAAGEAVADARANREKAQADIEASQRELNEIRRLKEKVRSQRDELEELSLLEGIFVDFKNHLMSRIAPALSEIASNMMDMMTDGKYDRIELDDDYQISIDDDGALHPVSRFSGGEADLANLSLRLAISRMIAERAGTNQVNLLVLDEIFGSLDPTRKRSVMLALSALAVQFRQVMLITHVDDMKDLMAHIVKVDELPDGTSTAKLVS